MFQMKQYLVDRCKRIGHFATCRKNNTETHFLLIMAIVSIVQEAIQRLSQKLFN
jgi:hypothetical protein